MAPGTGNGDVKPNQEIIESTLSELGLNRYEARVYLSLISEGVTTAKTISSITSIPYGKVYEVVDSLARKGFVHMLPTKPAKYKAISPRESLSKVKQEANEKFSKVESLLINTLEPVFNKNKKLFELQNNFWVLNGRSSVNQKLQELAGSARKDICIMTSPAGLARLKLMLPYLKVAKARGVKISITAPLKNIDNAELAYLKSYICNHIDEAHSTLVISDSKEALLIEPIPDDTSPYYGRDLAVWMANKCFVKCIEQFFNTASRNARQ